MMNLAVKGKSSQEGAQRRVAPLDVVRQRAQRPQEASEHEQSRDVSQRKAPPLFRNSLF
jgi:hypothetical protein